MRRYSSRILTRTVTTRSPAAFVRTYMDVTASQVNGPFWRKAVFRHLSDVRNTGLLPVMLDATFVCMIFLEA